MEFLLTLLQYSAVKKVDSTYHFFKISVRRKIIEPGIVYLFDFSEYKYEADT